jgi:hypothetical protein
MKNWWNKPLRAVTIEFPASNVATIDVAGIVDETNRGAVNTLNVFSIGYYPGGTSFYQSKIAPHYPGLGERDLLAEALASAHQNGQKVVAYIASIWGNQELFRKHPDWAQRHADGTVTSWDKAYSSVAMCPNSPFRAYLESIINEIKDNYDVDGFYFDEPSYQSWCSCSHCREKFYNEHHLELPVEVDWDDPIFQDFISWRYRQISDWRRELCELVQSDDRCAFVQGAFPLSKLTSLPLDISGIQFRNPYRDRFAVDWNVPLAHAAYLPDSAESGDLVHFELYRTSVREPLWWYGISLRYGLSIGKGKEMLILSMMAQTPFDQYGLPETEIRLSIAEILANSGSPLFARYYPDKVDQEAWEHVYAGLNEAKALEPFLSERESVKYAAVLYSQDSIDRFDHTGKKASHLGELKGIAKALLQNKILFDVITEDELDQLDQYKVFILPNATCMSGEAKQAIRDFVSKGGGLVASYESGLFDKRGWRTHEDDLSNLFGIAYSNEDVHFGGFDVYMQLTDTHPLPLTLPVGKLIPTGGIQLDVEPLSAQVVATTLGGAAVHYGPLGEESSLAAVLARQEEITGRVVYFAMPIGNRYKEFGAEDYYELIHSSVEWVAKEKAEIQLKNGPKTLALTAFRQTAHDRLIIHLVNSIRDEIICPITEVETSTNIQVLVKGDKKPTMVKSLSNNGPLAWEYESGLLNISVPEIHISEVIIVEYS